MKRFLPTVAVLILAGLTLFSGAIQGDLSNRWGVPADARAAGEVLETLPEQFAGWRLESADQLSDSVVDMLEGPSYHLATYVHESGQRVNLGLLCGAPGPISVHTPEICYSSREYNLIENRSVTKIDAARPPDAFWRLTLKSRDLDAHLLRVYYAWSDGGRWRAAESPRYEYAGRPYLFKLQLAGHAPVAPEGETAPDPCADFLEDFTPVWRQAAASLEAAP